jgi:hypothetical protein
MFAGKTSRTLISLFLTVLFLLAAGATALPCGPLAGDTTR